MLVRADLNVPLDGGRVADDTRIRAALPTLELLLERGAAIVLVSHLGPPEGRGSGALDGAGRATRLAELLDAEVELAPGVVGRRGARARRGDAARRGAAAREQPLRAGRDRATTRSCSARLAELADLYVNDAFGAAHRAHATTEGVARLLPAYAGLLLEREVEELTRVRDDPERPLVVVLGGAKVTDKIGVLERFLEIADEVLIGGAMCFSFFRAQGLGTGDSLVEEEGVEMARRLLEDPRGLKLPVDLVLGDSFSADAERREIDGVEVPDGWMGLDVGPRTVAAYSEAIAGAGTVLWNGPMGAFELEPFAAGTRGIAEAVADGARAHRGGRRRLGRRAGGVRPRGSRRLALDRGRRLARAARGQGAAGHRGARGCRRPRVTARERAPAVPGRQLEDEQDASTEADAFLDRFLRRASAI